MTPNNRNCRTRENGLSEVVGFVLILGVLVLVFSLYLTYGIPAQGRENEILHMNEVKDQFVSYKLSLDSLLDNNKIGSSASNSFTLGTGAGFTQGMMSIVPVLSPVSSTGVVAINQRVPGPANLSIFPRNPLSPIKPAAGRVCDYCIAGGLYGYISPVWYNVIYRYHLCIAR